MANTAGLKNLATKLIGTQGNSQVVQIRRVTDGAAGATPWKPASPTSADESVNGTVLAISDEKVDGTLVQRGDRLVLIAAQDVKNGKPTTADSIVIGGAQHKIINMEVVGPSGDDILYKVQVRQ